MNTTSSSNLSEQNDLQVQNFIQFIRNTTNFVSLTDETLTTSVSDAVKQKVRFLQSLVIRLDTYSDFAAHQLQLQNVNSTLNDVLDDLSDEFAQTEGRGLRLSSEQSEILQQVTELTIIIQGYLAIMNDTDQVINANYERLKTTALLRDLDTSTLEKVYQTLDKNLSVESTLRSSSTRTTFSDIFGIDAIRDGIASHLNETLLLSNDPSFDSYVFIVMTGPPGTGKTSIAHAIANQHSNGRFYNFDTAFLNSASVGETEKAITRIFDDIRKNPATNYTVIIDEIDNVLGVPGDPSFRDHMQTVKITLQTNIDESGNLKRNVVVVGMTNYFNRIDPIMHRRISYTVYVPPPTQDMLIAYFESLITKRSNRFFRLSQNYKRDFQNSILNSTCANASGSDNRNIFTNANIKQIHKNAMADSFRSITQLTLVFENSNFVTAIFGRPADFEIVDTNRFTVRQETTTRNEITNLYKTYQNQENGCFIVPMMESLQSATLLTNTMTSAQLKVFEEINNPQRSCGKV